MNGVAEPARVATTAQPLSAETPLAYYTPVAITPGTIKWIAGSIVALIAFLSVNPIAERWMMPAKQSELDQWVKVVQVLQQGQKEIGTNVDRLTLAIDNLSGIVSEMKATRAPSPRNILPVPTNRR